MPRTRPQPLMVILSVLLLFGMPFAVVLAGSTIRFTLISLTGVLSRGVEPGCIVLRTNDGQLYNLFNATVDPAAFGTEVQVRGYIVTNTATTCMQGIPFEVQEMSFINPTAPNSQPYLMMIIVSALVIVAIAIRKRVK